MNRQKGRSEDRKFRAHSGRSFTVKDEGRYRMVPEGRHLGFKGMLLLSITVLIVSMDVVAYFIGACRGNDLRNRVKWMRTTKGFV